MATEKNSISHGPTVFTPGSCEKAAGRVDRLRKCSTETEWDTVWTSSMKTFTAGKQQDLLRETRSKMTKDLEVERIAKKLDKMVHKKDTVSAKAAEKHAIR